MISTPPITAAAASVEHLCHVYARTRRKKKNGRGSNIDETAAIDQGRRTALDDVTFNVHPGEIFAILGPNGGGKTTLFRILATMLLPTTGTARVFNRDVTHDPQFIRARLGVVFQSPALDDKLSAIENLRHHGHLYGLRGGDLAARIEAWLDMFGLAARGHESVGKFSGGMKRRVELAKAMLHDPDMLLLDEPATGLDPGGRRDLWEQVERLRDTRGVTVILTTHLMDMAERCDRVAILDRGRLVAVNSPDRLKAGIGGHIVSVTPIHDVRTLCQIITDRFGPWPAGGHPIVANGQVRFEREDGAAFVGELNETLPGRIAQFTFGRPTLEDVFLHLTGHTLYGG